MKFLLIDFNNIKQKSRDNSPKKCVDPITYCWGSQVHISGHITTWLRPQRIANIILQMNIFEKFHTISIFVPGVSDNNERINVYSR